MQPEAAKPQILPPLTGIRGLTVLWMVTGHMSGVLTVLLPCVSGFVSVTLGVKCRMDLLFMLSGFLISYVYIANRGKLTLGAYADFLRLRLIRLYPVYIAATMLFVYLLEIVFPASTTELRLCLLLIVGGLIVVYLLLVRRVQAALRRFGDYISLRRTGFWLIALTASLSLVSVVVMTVRLSAMWGAHRAWTAILIRLAMAQVWPGVPPQGPAIASEFHNVTHAVFQNDTWHMTSVWFLSALWFAYLTMFPIAWLLVRRLGKSWPTFLWVFAPVAAWLTISLGPPSYRLPVIRACCEFLSGSALFMLYANGSRFIRAAQKHLDKTVLVFLAASLAIPAIQSEAARRYVNFLLVLAAPFLLAGTTVAVSYTAKFLSGRPMLWLGRISYALFMSHETALLVLSSVLPYGHYSDSSALVRTSVLVVYLAFIIAVAAGFYYLVESPCAVALKDITRRRAPSMATLSPRTVAVLSQGL